MFCIFKMEMCFDTQDGNVREFYFEVFYSFIVTIQHTIWGYWQA